MLTDQSIPVESNIDSVESSTEKEKETCSGRIHINSTVILPKSEPLVIKP